MVFLILSWFKPVSKSEVSNMGKQNGLRCVRGESPLFVYTKDLQKNKEDFKSHSFEFDI